jgi:hypothetical protein
MICSTPLFFVTMRNKLMKSVKNQSGANEEIKKIIKEL